MQWQECYDKAKQYIKRYKLPGHDLAIRSKLMGDASGKHLAVLAKEYESDYHQKWPGCSSEKQWTAVNWEDQIYVNSQDARLNEQCQLNNEKAVAAVLSHEIFHIKARSNYCANETNCLFEHEMLAHMVEDLVNKQGDPASNKLNSADIRRLSKQVFRNYIAGSLRRDDTKQDLARKLMTKRLIRKFHKQGVKQGNVRMHDLDLMHRVGLQHFDT